MIILFFFIIDEMSMINLSLFALIDTQLRKARKRSLDVITIFSELLLVILIDNFYQFAPVLGKALWNKAISEKLLHRKSFWSRFSSILILTEQIHQKIDLPFQKMLKRAWDKRLDSQNVRTLNQRLAIELPILGALSIVVIVQKNKTCYFINCLQIEKFVLANNRDIIIFPVEYYRIKKDDDKLV